MPSSKRAIDLALKDAAAPTLARMETERGKLCGEKVRAFHRVIVDNLFDVRLDVKWARQESGAGDHSVSTAFRRFLRRSPWRYFTEGRMEVADVLLRVNGFPVSAVSDAVGYNDESTFRRRFKAWYRQSPSDVRGLGWTPYVEQWTWRQAMWGQLPRPKAREVQAHLRRLYGEEDLPLANLLDVPSYERSKAAALWEEIREQPFKKQRELVRAHVFRGTALFDLLRGKSRREGRKDRRLGIRLARLALASLDGCLEAWTERGYELRAVAHAELGNAHRLAHDFAAAEAEFANCWDEWNTSRERQNPSVLAEISFLHGTLRMFQRRYDEALELLNNSLAESRKEGYLSGEIQALTQRAAVYGYLGRLEEETSDLEEVSAIARAEDDEFLKLTVEFNLAVAQVRRRNFQAGIDGHRRVKSMCSSLDYPKGEAEIEHLQGNISEGTGQHALAERQYARAYERFAQLGERHGAAFAGLDLAVVRSFRDQHQEVLKLVGELIPLLESLKLHPETLTAVRLLVKAHADTRITNGLLVKVREQLRQDPLLRLA